MTVSETRKPVADQATGFHEIEKLPGKFDDQNIADNLLHMQVRRIVSRFPVSLPTARVVAEIAFHAGGAQ